MARRRRASRSSAIACEQGGRGGASVEARGEVCGDEVADGAKNPGELSRGMECTLAERPQVRRYPARPSQPASIRPSPPSKPQGESLVTHQLTAGSGEGCTAQLHAHVTRVSRHGRTHRQTLRRRRAHARMSSPSPSSEARRKRGVCARATRGDETEKFGRFGVRGGTSSGRHAQTWRLSGEGYPEMEVAAPDENRPPPKK